MNNPPPTASMGIEALVREHNALVALVVENIELRQGVNAASNYIAQLEAALKEYAPIGLQEEAEEEPERTGEAGKEAPPVAE